MKKSLALLFLSFTIACSAWAEKYEYVRLKAKGTGGDTFTYNSVTYYKYDSITLQGGDIAMFVGTPHKTTNELFFDDGEDISSFERGGITPQAIVGPGTIYLGLSIQNWTAIPLVTNLAIQRASDTGSNTLAWNGTEWEGSSDGSQQANNDSSGGIDPTSIKYDELLGWAWFTDTPWVYSYTNLSWYYMHPTTEGFYVWNANLPDNGWILLERG